jgi:hypothetical protein
MMSEKTKFISTRDTAVSDFDQILEDWKIMITIIFRDDYT